MDTQLIFKPLLDHRSGSHSYLLAEPPTPDAVLIHAVYEQYGRDLALIRELDLHLLACLEAHCHADHVTGAWLLKHTLGCEIFASHRAGIELLARDLKEGDKITFGAHILLVIETPGHTEGCISF